MYVCVTLLKFAVMLKTLYYRNKKMKITRFFISNTFTRNTKLKFAKNQENPKQHHEQTQMQVTKQSNTF